MSKEIWLRGSVDSLVFEKGKPVIKATCAYHDIEPENTIHPVITDIKKLVDMACYVKGMINSSGNVLVYCKNGDLAPIGKVSKNQHVEHGVTVLVVTSDYSRDKPVEYVRSREDAERLCLMAEGFEGQDFDMERVCEINHINTHRASIKMLQNILRSVHINLAKEKAQSVAMLLDPNVLKMIKDKE